MTEFTNYFISRDGICYNVKTEKILKKFVRKDGYERVTLHKDKKRVVKRVDELVASIYLRQPEPNQVLIHKDLDKLNNDYNNLVYVTLSNYKHEWKKRCMTIQKQYDSSKELWKEKEEILCDEIAYLREMMMKRVPSIKYNTLCCEELESHPDFINMTDEEFEWYVEDSGGEKYRDECIHEKRLSAVLVSIKLFNRRTLFPQKAFNEQRDKMTKEKKTMMDNLAVFIRGELERREKWQKAFNEQRDKMAKVKKEINTMKEKERDIEQREKKISWLEKGNEWREIEHQKEKENKQREIEYQEKKDKQREIEHKQIIQKLGEIVKVLNNINWKRR